MKERSIGPKALFAPALIQSKVLLGSICEFFQPLTRKMHVAYQHRQIDRSLLYGLLCYDLGLPYMVKNMNVLFERFVKNTPHWKSFLMMRSPGSIEREYVDFIKQQLSLTQADEYKVKWAEMHLNGQFGVMKNMTIAKTILQTCKLPDCLIHLA